MPDLGQFRVRFESHGYLHDVASVTVHPITDPDFMPMHTKDRIHHAARYIDVYVDARDADHAVEVARNTRIGDLLEAPETT